MTDGKVRYNSHQEIFDHVAAHLLAQGVRAEVLNESSKHPKQCFYRKETDIGTLRCAVGSLIPPKLYRKRMEGINVIALLEKFPKFAALFNPEFRSFELNRFLRELQTIHDWRHPEEWRDMLAAFADTHKLSFRERA